MKRNTIIMLLMMTCIMTGCQNKGKDIEMNDDLYKVQDDTFDKTEYKSNVEHNNYEDESSQEPNYAGGINEETFTIKEHEDKEYTEEELEEINKNYDESAAPNIVIDEEDNSTEQSSDTEQEETENTLESKTINIDGQELEVYINE